MMMSDGPSMGISGVSTLKHSLRDLLTFPCSREVEAEIFQLGIRLDELKDLMDRNEQEPGQVGSDLALDSPPATPSPHQPTDLPSPLEQTRTSAIQTLGPEGPLYSTVLDCSFIHWFLH